MAKGRLMPSLSDIRVLLTGDDEADLAIVRSVLPAPPAGAEVVRGLGGAVAAMRLREFGVLVADVSAVQEALVLLRAARRARPATRGIVLMPADVPPDGEGWELVDRAAFALVRHPVETEALRGLIEEGRRDYLAERAGIAGRAMASGPSAEAASESEDARWLLAERRLTAVLRHTVTRWATASRGDMEDALIRGVGAVSEATREAQGSPRVLIALAEALGEWAQSEGEHEAA